MIGLDLKGTSILITGGTQGIGEGIARAAADAGAAGLRLTGRDAARGNRVAQDISKAGVRGPCSSPATWPKPRCRSIVDEAIAALRPHRRSRQRRRPHGSRHDR